MNIFPLNKHESYTLNIFCLAGGLLAVQVRLKINNYLKFFVLTAEFERLINPGKILISKHDKGKALIGHAHLNE